MENKKNWQRRIIGRVERYKASIAGFWSIYRDNKAGMFGLIILLLFILIAALAPHLTPYDPLEPGTIEEILSPPDFKHLLGTTEMGMDVLSQLIHASRTSLLVGLLAAAICVLIGTLIGLVAGFYGKIIDNVLMRINDIFLVIPNLPLMIVLAALLGPSIWNVVFVIGITGWCWISRVIRSQVLSVRERPFVESARVIGSSDVHIITRHVLPNVFGLVFANGVLVVANSILMESVLSFLGFGDPQTLSWGMMIRYAFSCGALTAKAYWYIVPPGICIVAVTLSFMLIGYSLDAIFNPKIQRLRVGSK